MSKEAGGLVKKRLVDASKEAGGCVKEADGCVKAASGWAHAFRPIWTHHFSLLVPFGSN